MITKPRLYSSAEVCRIVGISYRQLDYWIRVGTIQVDGKLPGSGYQRQWTEDELRRLKEVVAVYKSATSTLDAFRSGTLWQTAS